MYAYESVTVKKVIAPGVIKIEQNIREKLMNFKSKTAKTQKDTAWINSCRVISKNPILYKSLNYQNKILRKNIIKVKEDA